MIDNNLLWPAPPALREAGAREFAFTAEDFDRIRKMIHAHAGISLSETKQDMVYSRLARRLRETRSKSFKDYLALLDRGDKGEWEKFVNSLTTNLTSFFREPHHFPILSEHLKRLYGQRRSPLRIWCCASSTGEEPYSIAMTAVETFDSFNAPVSILASDLDTSVLDIAAKGVYAHEQAERLSAERLRRFFVKGMEGEGSAFTVRPELRRLVSFRRLNLLEPRWNVLGPLDVIFCRNVMIYFDKPTQHRILTRFAPLMSDDGLLFAGHSESFLHSADLFSSLGKTVYELTRRNR